MTECPICHKEHEEKQEDDKGGLCPECLKSLEEDAHG